MKTDNNIMTARKYLIKFAASIAIILCAIAGFNGLIDPLRLFGSPDITGINAIKNQFFNFAK